MQRQLLGIDWEYSMVQGNGSLPMLHWYSSEKFGDVLFTDLCLDRDIRFETDIARDKIVSIFREIRLSGRKLVVRNKDEATFPISIQDQSPLMLTFAELVTSFPTSIDDRLERILANLSRMEPRVGRSIPSVEPLDCLCLDPLELLFFLNLMKERNFIDCKVEQAGMRLVFSNGIHIRPAGWNLLEKMAKSHQSHQAFVAMSFHPSLDEAFLSIERSCNLTGFRGFRIDTKEHNNEISGEILFEIRRSRFCIADVTGQRPGVYFEAGYAMALGIPVIWTVRKDDLENVHFDTRQYNHVVWEAEAELQEKLTSRIRGSILP